MAFRWGMAICQLALVARRVIRAFFIIRLGQWSAITKMMNAIRCLLERIEIIHINLSKRRRFLLVFFQLTKDIAFHFKWG